MSQFTRSLRQWPMVQHRCIPLHHLFGSISLLQEPAKLTSYQFSLCPVASARRNVHSRSRGLRLANVPVPSELEIANNSDSESESELRKSRNQLKREARRAVHWGMELASFSGPQIKRILRAVSLDQEVFEALMLVKKLAPRVREGRRRQFNYIGKLLREVQQPDLMDKLIKATRDSDHQELQALSGLDSEVLEGDDNVLETDIEEDEEESDWYVAQATRWFDGLVNKDIQITNEVYSVQGVEFDRQELRKLVRRVHSTQEQQAANEEEEKNVDAAMMGAKKSLSRFLCSVAKQIPHEY